MEKENKIVNSKVDKILPKVESQPSKDSKNPVNQKSALKKKAKTKTIQVPIRIELKPDGRLVWDVAEVHRTIAKQCANNPEFAQAKTLVKKDANSLLLSDFVKSSSTTEGRPSEKVIPADKQSHPKDDKGTDSLVEEITK
jgi:hypothetical protein